MLYNRLAKGMPLQLDSTVAYVSQRSGDVWTTAAERANTSAYNTYAHAGLPPGPIGSPGEETIKAALLPAKGDWLYFVPDYEHHTTHFSKTYAEHQIWVAKLKAYCAQERRVLSDDARARRCAVVGSPIAHSLSPALHRAAYAELGLDWTYDHVEVDSAGLEDVRRRARRVVARAVPDDAAQADRRTPARQQLTTGCGSPASPTRSSSTRARGTASTPTSPAPSPRWRSGCPRRPARRSCSAAEPRPRRCCWRSPSRGARRRRCSSATRPAPRRRSPWSARTRARPSSSVGTLADADRDRRRPARHDDPGRGPDTRAARRSAPTCPPSSRSSTTRGRRRSPGPCSRTAVSSSPGSTCSPTRRSARCSG